MMNEILVVDYGMGNLRSVQKAIEHLGGRATISRDPDAVDRARALILPGVGAFRDAMTHLRELNLVDPIRQQIRRGTWFLGICLGHQLLFRESHEDGLHEGLGVFDGVVERFTDEPGIKVPHMGWNYLRVVNSAPLFTGLHDDAAVYFVHSYHVVPNDRSLVATETDYPTPFVSSIWRDNVFGVQFHPEKSQQVGLGILHKFITLR